MKRLPCTAALFSGLLLFAVWCVLPRSEHAIAAGQSKATFAVKAGDFEWRTLDDGFDVAEMPLRSGEAPAGRVLLARFDPAKFRFTLHNEPSGRFMADWIARLGAVMVINGSFFLADGTPATPTLSEGVLSGPKSYRARHGAFVTSPEFTGIRDLAKQDWSDAFKDARSGTVSFPLLIAADGRDAVQPSDKNADRSFVGQDASGRIILGTTEAHFTLPDFAAFLKAEALDLKLALNLDGGPYGCHAIAHKAYARSFCGMNAPPGQDGGAARSLSRLDATGLKLPIVLAIAPK